VFLAHVGPRGRALVDKRLYLPEGWSSDPGRCAAVGVPEFQRRYRAKTDLALEMLQQARARGYLSAGWAAGDDVFGRSPVFRDGLTAEGMQYVLDVPPVWPLEPTWQDQSPGLVGALVLPILVLNPSNSLISGETKDYWD